MEELSTFSIAYRYSNSNSPVAAALAVCSKGQGRRIVNVILSGRYGLFHNGPISIAQLLVIIGPSLASIISL